MGIQDKYKLVKEDLKDSDTYFVVLTALDEIAYYFNLRGSDVECNPVFVSYAIISEEQQILYIN